MQSKSEQQEKVIAEMDVDRYAEIKRRLLDAFCDGYDQDIWDDIKMIIAEVDAMKPVVDEVCECGYEFEETAHDALQRDEDLSHAGTRAGAVCAASGQGGEGKGVK